MASRTQNKNYEYFSANVYATEVEEELTQAKQRITELESLNGKLEELLSNDNSVKNNPELFVELDQIIRNPEQVRRYFDPDKLAILTASIKEVGLKSSLWVRPARDGKYLLIAGERRYRAAKNAGLVKVPISIIDVDDVSALQLSLLENLQREDLNPVEETEGILNLLSLRLSCSTKEIITLLNRKAHLDKKQINWQDEDTENVFRKQWETIENVFSTVGKLSPESFRVSRLPLLNMPSDILEVLRLGQIEYTKARMLASVKDESLRSNLLTETISQKLSIKQIRDRIKKSQLKESPSLKQEFQDISRRMLKSANWNNPKKVKKISTLLKQLEALLVD